MTVATVPRDVASRTGILSLCGLLCGCSAIWGGKTRSDPDNCVVNPDVCQPGTHCNPVTEACEGDPLPPPPDMTVLAQSPSTYIFPGPMGTSQTFPRDAVYALEVQRSATIYYTLDGSRPVPGMGTTQAAVGRAALGTVPGGTTIRYFAHGGAGYAPAPEQSFTVLTSSTPPSDFGFIPNPAIFDLTGTSIVTVAPGTHLTGSVQFEAWQSTPTGYCPGCIIQYVAAVDSVGAVGCLNTVSTYGPYPGQTATLPFAFDAPMQPGRYRLFSGLTLEFTCDGSVGGGPDLGEVFVQ